MTKKNIEFASGIEFLEKPKASKMYIPEWYRKAERFVGGKPYLNGYKGKGTKTVKLCVPFMDSMLSGYMIELFQDVQVIIGDDGKQFLQWGIGVHPAAEFREQNTMAGMPAPHGCDPQPWAWKFPFSWRTPRGYSALVTHPFNRFELPFVTVSGIVDAENVVNQGNLPFFLKEGWEGIIPAGTPIAQILPFKRDSWESKINEELIQTGIKQNFLNRRVTSGWYKKDSWVRKEFN